jgi:dUTP pyrophosphatase
MSYRMIYALQRLMCDKFSILCTLAELNAKQEREEMRMRLNVKIKRLNEAAVIPKYAHEGDAGIDLVAVEDVIIEPGETKLIQTGLAFEIPPNFEIQVRPRSGVTLKTKLRVQLGTIDSNYRGEVGVIVDNIAERNHRTGNVLKTVDGKVETLQTLSRYLDENTYIIRKGDRIGQAVIAPVEHAYLNEVKTLSETQRGQGGFGSTGVTEEKEVPEMVTNINAEISELKYNALHGEEDGE